MTGKEVLLSGTVTEVSRPAIAIRGVSTRDYHPDQDELVTFSVEGAEPLWAELRIQNRHGWAVREKVAISIVSVERKQIMEAS
jgi:hypothetical protein